MVQNYNGSEMVQKWFRTNYNGSEIQSKIFGFTCTIVVRMFKTVIPEICQRQEMLWLMELLMNGVNVQ